MVRFHWHVEHGLSAYCPREPAALAEGGVRHIEAEAEISGQKETLPMVFTTPPNCFGGGPIRDVGVVLAHSDVVEWKGRLLTELAVALAASGVAVSLLRSLAALYGRCSGKSGSRLQALSCCASAASTRRRDGCACTRRRSTRWRPLRTHTA